ncbi:hypothetical protein SPRG_00190 [Saprolegnia parasitica CBS 223.65]|uniref:Uncharacterized protein n=1 Tax=Saprolegnia parasitica (strain CBS 223.65) TaxID=695850 RepID=A0A067D9K9_SAPPC|nr:hypothetical protein SPRG_00190 [Saprolegnia parasitica CBS 223.65]KDO35341.1 hypothetical protein SPRG_00190 [Saprolegnia parasitica CBS 223.65]|eukprot:XP_012193687.1 hypothetical protein SPRG_00190 [Saprolegnia parasitica CBS 223.65]
MTTGRQFCIRLSRLTRVPESFESTFFATQDALEAMTAQYSDQEQTIAPLRLVHADVEAHRQTLQDHLMRRQRPWRRCKRRTDVTDAAQEYARLETEAVAQVAARDAQIQDP